MATWFHVGLFCFGFVLYPSFHLHSVGVDEATGQHGHVGGSSHDVVPEGRNEPPAHGHDGDCPACLALSFAGADVSATACITSVAPSSVARAPDFDLGEPARVHVGLRRARAPPPHS